MFRYLRIAISSLTFTACILLTVLWVRSYWRLDGIVHDRGRHVVAIVTEPGGIVFEQDSYASGEIVDRWHLISERLPAVVPKPALRRPAFTWQNHPDWTAVYLPYPCLVLFTGAIATISWIHWSRTFSLRTLLLITSFVAIALGLIVWPR
jgi:hypothetical protein